MLVTLITTGRYADPVDYFGPNLDSNQILLQSNGRPQPGPDPGPAPTSTLSPQQYEDQADAIAASVNTHNVLPLQSTDAFLARHTATGDIGGPGTIYLATPVLLAHYGIDPTSIQPGTLLITSREGLAGTSHLSLVSGDADPQARRDPAIQTSTRLPTDASAPNLIATQAAVTALHLTFTSDTWLIQAPHTLTAIQINTARQIAAAANMTIETKSQAPSLSAVRDDATYTGILIALGVLAMTVGLIRSESAGELRTLSATGASSRTRRAITAATAGTLAVLSAVLGTSVAYLVSTAFFRSQLSERMGHPPTTNLVLVLIGLPLLATVGGWIFAGRQPPAIAHQPIE